jgi:hypothetical protein
MCAKILAFPLILTVLCKRHTSKLIWSSAVFTEECLALKALFKRFCWLLKKYRLFIIIKTQINIPKIILFSYD